MVRASVQKMTNDMKEQEREKVYENEEKVNEMEKYEENCRIREDEIVGMD